MMGVATKPVKLTAKERHALAELAKLDYSGVKLQRVRIRSAWPGRRKYAAWLAVGSVPNVNRSGKFISARQPFGR